MVAVLTVCEWIAMPTWGQSEKQRHQPSEPTEKTAAAAKNDQRGTKDSPLMIEIQERAKSESEAALEKNANDHKEFNDEVTAWSAAIAAFCTFLLVIVGGFGVCYAIRTLRAIERQAGLLEVQAALMEASMTQWVSVANWKASITQRVGPLSHQPKELLVEFEIANESNLPLTMQATFRFFGNLPNAARFRTLDDFVLFPRKPYSPSAR